MQVFMLELNCGMTLVVPYPKFIQLCDYQFNVSVIFLILEDMPDMISFQYFDNVGNKQIKDIPVLIHES